MPQNPMIRALVIFLIGLLILLMGAAAYLYFAPAPQVNQASFDSSGSGATSSVGTDYSLLNEQGQRVYRSDFEGLYRLYYFGYTFCPDVCPFDMARNALAVDLLKEEGYDINLAFITIDPERDTPEIVGEYAAAMHPNAIGLSGTAEQVRTAARAYKVYYAKGAGTDDSYLMDHSAFTYLMFPETGLATYFGRQVSAEEMASETACHIRAM